MKKYCANCNQMIETFNGELPYSHGKGICFSSSKLPKGQQVLS